MKCFKIAKPHLIPNTNILKNIPGITNQEDLDRFELLSFLARLDTTPERDLSTNHLKKVHAHSLKDVYEWAGEFRNVPIEKGTSVFCRPEFIVQEIDKITKSINILRFKKMDFKMFSKNLAEIVGELNAVHPFLDGNGRAIRVYAQKLSKTVGYELNVSDLRQHFMRKLCKKAGVKKFGFHAIRHFTASSLYRLGSNLSEIQAILRHKSPSTTERYLKSLGIEKVRGSLEKFSLQHHDNISVNHAEIENWKSEEIKKVV